MNYTTILRTVALSVICLFWTSVTVSAQKSSFLEGYIITNSNDTIRGELSLRTDLINGNVCRFKTSPNASVEVYHPGNIAAYRYTPKGKYYVSRSVEINGTLQTVFLEYLVQGGLTLYYYRSDLCSYYFLENSDKKLVAISDARIEKTIDTPTGSKQFIGVDPSYKRLTASMMRDWEDVQERVVAASLNHEGMIKLVADYNEAVCKNDSCIIYYSNNPTPLKVSFAIFGGGVYGLPLSELYEEPSRTVNGYQLGAQFLFNSPRFSKALSLLAEVSYIYAKSKRPFNYYNRYDAIETSSNVIDLRCLGRYAFGSSKLRPFAEAGFAFSFNLSNKQNILGEDLVKSYGDANIYGRISPIVGAGLMYRVFAKQDVFVQGFWNVRKTSSWGIRAGLIF